MKDYLENKDFVKQRTKTMKKITRASKKAMQRIQSSYEFLIPLAKERGLQLCLENREGMEEMPLDPKYPDFLAGLPEPEHVGYWHDTGHAQIKDQLGLLEHEAHLESLADRLLGFHLHDVSVEGRDHQTIGTGVIDFKMISKFVRPEHSLVLELSPKLTTDQIKASRDYVLDLLG